MGAVAEIWFKSLIPFLLKDSHIVQWLIDKEHKTQTYISVFTENNIKSHYPQIGIYMETYKSERHIGPRYLSEAPACSNRAPTPRPSHTTPTKKEEEKKRVKIDY